MNQSITHRRSRNRSGKSRHLKRISNSSPGKSFSVKMLLQKRRFSMERSFSKRSASVFSIFSLISRRIWRSFRRRAFLRSNVSIKSLISRLIRRRFLRFSARTMRCLRTVSRPATLSSSSWRIFSRFATDSWDDGKGFTFFREAPVCWLVVRFGVRCWRTLL